MKTKITYTYRAEIERPCTKHGKPSFRWSSGYSANTSETGILFPWMTRPECSQDAKRQGKTATFQTDAGRNL